MQGAFLFPKKPPGAFSKKSIFWKGLTHMGVYEELQARGLLAQVTNEEEIR